MSISIPCRLPRERNDEQADLEFQALLFSSQFQRRPLSSWLHSSHWIRSSGRIQRGIAIRLLSFFFQVRNLWTRSTIFGGTVGGTVESDF